ncbi:MAG: hypothetical protein ISR77_16185 [Pirellulaceae bacterium]|nr:hypothetical protein [Pirellulaceae bacterium]
MAPTNRMRRLLWIARSHERVPWPSCFLMLMVPLLTWSALATTAHLVAGEPPADEAVVAERQASDKKEEKAAKVPKNAFFTALVVDAATGEPIPEFIALAGTSHMDDIGWQWQSHTIHAFAHGKLQWPPPGRRGYREQVLRVEAEGYKPFLTPPIKQLSGEEAPLHGGTPGGARDLPGPYVIYGRPGQPGTLDIRLERDPGVAGRVMTPAGEPAAGAQIAVATAARTVRIKDGNIPLRPLEPDASRRDRWRRPLSVTADGQGRFKLPTEISPAAVAIAHPAGFAAMSFEDLLDGSEVILEPWGEIEGRLMWGDVPGVGETIDIGARTRVGRQFHLILSMHESVETDAQGRFHFRKVPPGLAQVSRVMRPAGTDGASYRPIQFVEVNAGKPTPLVFGGKGRPVIGKLSGRDNWKQVRIRLAPNAPPMGFMSGAKDPTWAAYGQFLKSPAGKNYVKSDIAVMRDGSFHINDVPPETYQLFVDETREDGKTARIGYSRFTIKTIPGGESDEPFELETIEVRPRADP